MSDSRTSRLRVPVVAVGVGLLALAVAVAIHEAAPGSTSAGHSLPVVDRGTLPTGATLPAGTGTGAAAGRGPGAATGRPAGAAAHHVLPAGSRLHYRRLGISASIVDVSVRAGVMDVPANPRVVGWWRQGAGAGDAGGSVVLVGHVNYAGVSGALGVLPEARPGDAVSVAEPGGHAVGYRVAAVRTYPKTNGIPGSAFDATGPARLVLITCGGPFDAATGNYEDNIVVYATPDV